MQELAEAAAQILGAEPVITTATDLRQAFAVDVFAAENELVTVTGNWRNKSLRRSAR